MNLKSATRFDLVKETYHEWDKHDASRLAAALAYYTVFSIAPLLVIAVAIAGLLFGVDSARDAILGQVGALVGAEGAETIAKGMASASKPGAGIVATIINVVVLVVGAASVFSELQSSMNALWDVAAKPDRTMWQTLRSRFRAATMVLGIGFLLMVSLVLSAVLAALGHYVSGSLPGGEAVWHIVNFVVSMAIIAVLFAMLFKYVPDAKVRWGDVWAGAILTSLLFTIGKLLIGLYLGKSSFSSAYGAAGSILVVLVWVYYSAQILFFGGAFTRVWARRHGARIEPTDDAMRLGEAKKTQAGAVRTDRPAGAHT